MLADKIRTANKDRFDYLFWQKDIYTWRLNYELSIFGYYVNTDHHNLSDISMKLITNPDIGDLCYKNIQSNYKFYAPKLIETKNSKQWKFDIPTYLDSEQTLISTTPTICKLRQPKNANSALLIGTRYVNYRIDDNGNYINQNHIISKTMLSMYELSSESFSNRFSKKIIHDTNLEYNETLDGHCPNVEKKRKEKKKT